MTEKTPKSRLFQASPDHLLLDERVSKIVLPALDANRAQMDEKEVHWGLKSPELVDELPTETLQIFVGTGQQNESDWDIPDDDPFADDFDDIDEDLPNPMVLSFNTAAAEVSTETPELKVPVGVTLHAIQEIQVDEELPSPDLDDDWDSINWDDVTLSDILGDETEIIEIEPDTRTTGALLTFDDEESSEDVFPVQVAIEDIPDWTEDWDNDLSEEGAELNLDDDWFSQEVTARIESPELASTASVATAVSDEPTQSVATPIVAPQDNWWSSPLVVIWIVILLVAFCAALLWRIMQ